MSQETSDLEGKLSLHKPGDLESESAGNFSEAHVQSGDCNPCLQGCSKEYMSMSCGSALSLGSSGHL